MSANVETMMSVREVPWHGIGVVLEDYPENAYEAMVAAGLDWSVEKRPIFYKEGKKYTAYEPNVLTVRTSDEKPLGVVGSKYAIIQNEEQFEFIESLLDTADVKYETAGSLREGGLVWVLVEVDRPIKIDGDVVVPYLLVTNGHDGWNSFSARTTPVRVVCQNTLRLAIAKTRSKWSIRHTGDPRRKLDEARATLDLSISYYDEFEREVEKLIETAVTEHRFDSIVSRLIPKGETERSETLRTTRRNAIKQVYYESENVGRFQGTGWGVVNAISEYELWTPTKSKRDHLTVQAEKIFANEATPMTHQAHRMLSIKR